MDNRAKIFFSGIGGSGVSAIACFMFDRGCRVRGSDRAFDSNPAHPVLRMLRAKGVEIAPQDGSGLDGSFDFAVFSTAVEPDRPEAVKARALGIPVKTRPEYLAEIVKDFRTVAVAGTSGKSTTSGMLAFLMRELGLKPNFIGGGRVKQFKTQIGGETAIKTPGNSITGASGTLVIEACESDGTIVNYFPMHTVILNLDVDHHGIEETRAMFETLAGNTRDGLIVNADDGNLLKADFGNRKTTTFGLGPGADFRAADVHYRPFGTEFTVNGIRFSLGLPGEYNLYNALSSIAMLSRMGVQLEDIAKTLPRFEGIERRFDVHLNGARGLVIDDYAHNPHKISSLMQAVSRVSGRICYVFQPHGFAPTRMMKDGYMEAFARNMRAGDRLVLLPIFYAGGTVSRDISSEVLAAGIKAAGKQAEVCTRGEVLEKVLPSSGRWSSYVVMGARDETLSDFAREIAQKLSTGFRRYDNRQPPGGQPPAV
ncbi:MAG: Mur ligase family protein [Nitrospiraceae bacterium]|nr:Mur ligase family protein [Nitrospiraceae bacterium]